MKPEKKVKICSLLLISIIITLFLIDYTNTTNVNNDNSSKNLIYHIESYEESYRNNTNNITFKLQIINNGSRTINIDEPWYIFQTYNMFFIWNESGSNILDFSPVLIHPPSYNINIDPGMSDTKIVKLFELSPYYSLSGPLINANNFKWNITGEFNIMFTTYGWIDEPITSNIVTFTIYD